MDWVNEQAQWKSMHQEEKYAIWEHITLFVFALVKAPGIWAELLANDQIEASTTEIVINGSETVTEVYWAVIDEVNRLVKEGQGKS